MNYPVSMRPRKAFKISIFLLTLVSSLNMSSSFAYEYDFVDMFELDQYVLYLGDNILVNSGACYATKSNSSSTSKIRLEVLSGNTWKSVGKLVFKKDGTCSSKKPYSQFFSWEIDRIGSINSNKISGTISLRNRVIKPTIYSEIIVYRSENAFNKEQQDIALQGARDAQAKKDADYIRELQFLCLISSGQWNYQGNYCIPPK
jgi:hypothetical protein